MDDERILTEIRACLTFFCKNKKSLRGDGLIDRISKHTQISVVNVKSAFLTLKNDGELICDNWYNGLPLSKVTLNLKKKPITPDEERWISIMGKIGFTEKETKSLLMISDTLSEFNQIELENIASGLKKIKEDQHKLHGLSRFHVSATYLLGSSKLLDAIPSYALKEFGVDVNNFSRPPSYIVVAGPVSPECVILVENPQAMENALLADISNVAWITTFGYGLSMIGEDYGRQLASIIEDQTRPTYLLTRAGNPPTLDLLLSNEQIYFWGDLDPEGLKIYLRIKSKIPSLELSGLYKPMLSYLLSSEYCHPYVKATGKEGQISWNPTDMILKKLMEHCASKGIDQEILTPAEIEKFAQAPFNLN